MPIEHSAALETLQRFAKSFERKLIEIPGLDQEVYVTPLTGEMADKLSRYTGTKYNVRLLAACCEDKNGGKLFTEEDIPFLMQLPIGIISIAANQIVDHIAANFDAVKNS